MSAMQSGNGQGFECGEEHIQAWGGKPLKPRNLLRGAVTDSMYCSFEEYMKRKD